MPNKQTFLIKPIRQLLGEEIAHVDLWADPFAGLNSPVTFFSNDLDPNAPTRSHVDALEYLRTFSNQSLEGIIFDPPYSPRQVSECYKKLGKTVNIVTTQASYWGNLKREIARIVMPHGKCITFGWNSGGIGKIYGFKITRILLVPHGGWHNDTIVTVERKLPRLL